MPLFLSWLQQQLGWNTRWLAWPRSSLDLALGWLYKLWFTSTLFTSTASSKDRRALFSGRNWSITHFDVVDHIVELVLLHVWMGHLVLLFYVLGIILLHLIATNRPRLRDLRGIIRSKIECFSWCFADLILNNIQIWFQLFAGSKRRNRRRISTRCLLLFLTKHPASESVYFSTRLPIDQVDILWRQDFEAWLFIDHGLSTFQHIQMCLLVQVHNVLDFICANFLIRLAQGAIFCGYIRCFGF